MQEEYSLESIKDIRKKVQSLGPVTATLIAVIVDSANPHRKDIHRDYLMRLKVIDSSSPTDPLQVFLFGRDIEDFPRSIKVGDIIFLHQYTFETWNNSLQAKRSFQSHNTISRFFSGDPELSNYSHIDAKTGLDDSQGVILGGINECRHFSKGFFKSNAVPLYSKSGTASSSDFDLILSVQESVQLSTGAYRIRMTNAIHAFQINYSFNLAPGVYKLRSVADLVWKDKLCLLEGNDYTCFLEISSWMKSFESKEWEKIVPTGKVTERKIERPHMETKILKEKRGNFRNLITLKELISKENHDQEIRVKVEFMNSHTKFEQALRRYDDKNIIEKSYESDSGEYIFSMHFTVGDESIPNEVFNIYIYTYDQRGLEFLPELDPKNIFGRNILALREKYNALIDRLLEETDAKECPVELVLSPLWNGKETIYRIVDTELLL